MKKILIVAHNSRFVAQFELNNIRLLRSLGYEVHCATNFENETMVADAKHLIEQSGAIVHQFDIERLHFTPKVFTKNLKACKQLRTILEDDFDLVHCHTPIGGVIARLAAKPFRRKGTKVIYTAHGFHFFKGAPLINWLLYFPVEWALSYVTDVLVTINEEDYRRAQKMGAKKVCYIPGVGIDVAKLRQHQNRRSQLRTELGLREDAFVLLSVGEVNRNKNHRVIMKALAKLKDRDIFYVICGDGPLMETYRCLAEELGIADRVILTGFRSDVADLYKAADLFVFPSFREGLSVALMEAMACGLPVACSKIRGNVDLIKDGVSGYVVSNDADAFASAIRAAKEQPETRAVFAAAAGEHIQKFDLEYVMQAHKELYLTI